MENNKVKLSEMRDRQQLQIVEREGIWVNTGEGMDVKGNKWCYCKRFEDKKNGLMVDFAYIPADTEVEIVPTEEEQAINDIKVSQLCQSEDIVITEEDMQELVDKALERMGKEADEMLDTLCDMTKPAGNGFYDQIQQYTAEDIERIRQRGINSDQEDKTDWEEYIDAIASKRIIDEYDKNVEDKVGDMKKWLKDNQPTYEEMLERCKVMECKIMQWYVKTKDEEYLKHMELTVKRQGEI